MHVQFVSKTFGSNRSEKFELHSMAIVSRNFKYIFPKLVDGTIYSYDVGLRKPDESIYIRACELANVNPTESVFIDDLIENIDGAKKIGINGIHFTGIEALSESLKELGITN